MIRRIILIIGFVLSLTVAFSQTLRDSVWVERESFKVLYSETLEQPLMVTYVVVPIVKKESRNGIKFYTDKDIHTSDDLDYKNNIWDRGHMAPARHFTDSKRKLKSTFSFLNIALQHQKLNQGEWRLLEEQESLWSSDYENLIVTIKVIFSDKSERLETGALIPDGFYKEIKFIENPSDKSFVVTKKLCWYFPNTEPDKSWDEYKVDCNCN